jgi:hypothetical protein
MPALRKQRMQRFLRLMQPSAGQGILDIGGLPSLNGIPGFWQEYSDQFKITLLNLPGTFDRFSNHELAPYRLIEADACMCNGLSGAFDIVFSNALIEHVGNCRRQRLLANFVRSAGNSFWVQTPSPFFPIEAHCDIPCWWFLPARQRKYKIAQWKRRGERFLARQMASTRPIWPKQLRELFPESRIVTEYLMGFPKSHIAYRRHER